MTYDTFTPSAQPEDFTSTSLNAPTPEESKSDANTAETSSISSTMLPAELISTTTDVKSSSRATQHSNASMDEQFNKVIEGAKYVAERVMPTLGAQGSSALIESMMRPFHTIVDDGRKVAESIVLDDSYENLGASVMREVAMQSDKESQDGTTTAVTLAYHLIQNHLAAGQKGTKVKRSLEKILPDVIKAIDAQKREITLDDVYQVAFTSSNDEEIAELFSNVYKEIGKDGLIELDNSHVPATHYEITDGVKLRGAGYIGAYCTTEPGKGVYDNPRILISKEKITTTTQIDGIAEKLANSGIQQLVIYCEEMDMSVATKIAAVHLNGGFKTAIIVSPSLFKDWIYEDFALLTGATPADNKNGKTFKNFTLQDLGTCEKLIITKDETRVYGGRDVSEHIANLKEQGKADDQLLIRAAWLSTKAATLKIGANSEVELAHKRAKVMDAAGACRLALEGGIVPGAGQSLVNAAFALAEDKTVPFYVINSLLMPAQTIADNGEYKVTLHAGTRGVNALTGEEGDLFEMNIVDPANVVKNSVSAAFSIAGTLLSIRAVLPIPKALKERAERQMSGMPQY